MKTTKLKILILTTFTLLLLLAVGCKKDPMIFPDGSVCEDFPSTPAGIGYQYQSRNPTLNKQAPYFNPNNAAEIVFTTGDSVITSGDNLYTLNLNTGQKKYLANNVWYQPKWSVKNWIVFNRAGSQLWKIKSNGDSLTQLTFSNENYDPEWSPDGEKLVYRQVIGSVYSIMITTANGYKLDSITNAFYGKGSWAPNNTKIATIYNASTGHNIGLIDLQSKAINAITSYPEQSPTGKTIINSMDWSNDSQSIFWCSGYGLYKTDVNTGITTQLKYGCDRKYYIYPSVSPDGQKIIVDRVDQKLLNHNTIYVETNLYIMDINGENETKINY